jgi:hypothetical protein
MIRTLFGAWTVLTLSACLFFPDDENGGGNPFLGQWKATEESSYTVRDSVIREEFRAFLLERGYDFTNGFPETPIPDAVIDSFNATFSCAAAVCDSVLWIQKSYLVASPDSLVGWEIRNGIPVSRSPSSYTWDADSLYTVRYLFWFDTVEVSSVYRFSSKRDTLFLDDYGLPLPYVRNSDPLPD